MRFKDVISLDELQQKAIKEEVKKMKCFFVKIVEKWHRKCYYDMVKQHKQYDK